MERPNAKKQCVVYTLNDRIASKKKQQHRVEKKLGQLKFLFI